MLDDTKGDICCSSMSLAFGRKYVFIDPHLSSTCFTSVLYFHTQIPEGLHSIRISCESWNISKERVLISHFTMTPINLVKGKNCSDHSFIIEIIPALTNAEIRADLDLTVSL